MEDASRSPQELVNVLLGRRTVPHSQLENTLVECFIIMDQSYYGLRRQDIKGTDFQLAIRNGLKHLFNQENLEAGKKQLQFFLQWDPVISENS